MVLGIPSPSRLAVTWQTFETKCSEFGSFKFSKIAKMDGKFWNSGAISPVRSMALSLQIFRHLSKIPDWSWQPMFNQENLQYLSVKEVAALLGFHPETIKRWARGGKIEFQQAGHYGHIRVKWPLERPGKAPTSHKELQTATK